MIFEKTRCVVLMLAACFPMLASPASGQWSDKYWKRSSPKPYHEGSIVKVRCGSAGGSGTFVHYDSNGGYVITALHVVGSRGRRCNLTWQNGHKATGTVITTYRGNDTAMIRFSPIPSNPIIVPVADKLPPKGTMVEVCGYGGADGFRNFYAALRDPVNSYEVSVNTSVISGDSGGGIIHNGRLIGVVSGGPYRDRRNTLRSRRGSNWSLVYPCSGGGGPTILKRLFGPRDGSRSPIRRQTQPQYYYYQPSS